MWFWFGVIWWIVRLIILLSTFWPYVCLPLRNVCLDLLPLLILDCLFVIDFLIYSGYYPLSYRLLANIFFHSIGCLFTVECFLSMQKLFSLVYSHFFVYVFNYFIYMKEGEGSTICWFLLQMPATASPGPDWIQEPGIHFKSPRWMIETQTLQPSSDTSQGVHICYCFLCFWDLIQNIFVHYNVLMAYSFVFF